MSREEHMAWCKDRALEYLPGSPAGAVASMLSDLGKHPDTAPCASPMFALLGMMEIGQGPEAVRRYIEGFN